MLELIKDVKRVWSARKAFNDKIMYHEKQYEENFKKVSWNIFEVARIGAKARCEIAKEELKYMMVKQELWLKWRRKLLKWR